MDQKKKTVLLAAVFIAALAVVYYVYTGLSSRYETETGLPASGPAASQEASGSASSAVEAPDFTVYDSGGNAVRLSDFRGKPVVLNFWASWCYYCSQEMPEFSKAYAEDKDKVQFLFVNWTDGQRETQEKAEAYLKQNGYSFPVYYDLDQNAVSAYGLSGIPATVFIRADGTVAGGRSGAMDGDTLKNGIELITE